MCVDHLRQHMRKRERQRHAAKREVERKWNECDRKRQSKDIKMWKKIMKQSCLLWFTKSIIMFYSTIHCWEHRAVALRWPQLSDKKVTERWRQDEILSDMINSTINTSILSVFENCCYLYIYSAVCLPYCFILNLDSCFICIWILVITCLFQVHLVCLVHLYLERCFPSTYLPVLPLSECLLHLYLYKTSQK